MLVSQYSTYHLYFFFPDVSVSSDICFIDFKVTQAESSRHQVSIQNLATLWLRLA